MRILMICTEKLPVPPIRGGAIQTYIHNVSLILAKHHELTIIGIEDVDLPSEETRNSIRFIRVPRSETITEYAGHIVSFLKNNVFDLIHIFNRPKMVLPVRSAAPDSRIVLSMHNDMFDPLKLSPREGVKIIEQCDSIVTVSNYVGERIEQFYPIVASKWTTVYSGVDLARFVPWKSSKTATQCRERLRREFKLVNKTVILFAGRLSVKKGADVLIRSLYQLKAYHKDAVLVVVGGAWYSSNKISDYIAYLKCLAERSPIPVILTGYVAGEQIHEWFWAADVFICPSQWNEPLARVHYEAMAAGLPIVTTARGGNAEVMDSANGIVIAEPDSTEEMASSLGKLLASEGLRQRMGASGRTKAQQQFSWQRVADQLLEIWGK